MTEIKNYPIKKVSGIEQMKALLEKEGLLTRTKEKSDSHIYETIMTDNKELKKESIQK